MLGVFQFKSSSVNHLSCIKYNSWVPIYFVALQPIVYTTSVDGHVWFNDFEIHDSLELHQSNGVR